MQPVRAHVRELNADKHLLLSLRYPQTFPPASPRDSPNFVPHTCHKGAGIDPVRPPRGPDTRLHPALLGLFGLAMGELFDLVELSRECKKRKRYEFAFVAKPFRLTGGVGSPANAMAIF